MKVAHDHEAVLDKPEPTALFRAFGGSSLEFELRVFISGVDRRLSVMHELLRDINRIFIDHHIDIAFPQQDVHMDTSRPLDVRVVNETDYLSDGDTDSERPEKNK